MPGAPEIQRPQDVQLAEGTSGVSSVFLVGIAGDRNPGTAQPDFSPILFLLS